MKKRLLPAVAATVITAMCLPAYGFDVTYSGFVNVIGGFTDAANTDTCNYLQGWGTEFVTQLDKKKGSGGALGNYSNLIGRAPICTGGNRPSFNGYKEKINFTDPTSVGLQLKGDVNDSLSVTLQMTSHGYNDFSLNAAWMYMTYMPTDNLMFRVGRIRNPIFMLSENLEVGYTYPWINTPVEVYGQVRVDNLEGAVATYNNSIGEWDYNLSLFGGTTHVALPFSGQFVETRLMNGVGANFEFGNEDLKLRAGYAMTRFTMDSNPPGSAGLSGALDLWGANVASETARLAYIGALGSATPGVPGMAQKISEATYDSVFYGISPYLKAYKDKLSVKGRFGSFIGLGYQYDKGNIVSMGEFTMRNTDSIILQSTQGWYAMLGYRIGQFMPHITYAGNRTRDDSKRQLADGNYLTAVAMSACNAAAAAAAAGGVSYSCSATDLANISKSFASAFNNDFATGANYSSNSYTFGLRWNAMPAAVLKAEYSLLQANNHTQGGFDIYPGKKNTNLYKLAVEAVF